MPATIYHAYTNTVANGTATSVVRPSDWNSAHQVTISPSGQEIIGAFSNAGNVTFGTNTAGYVTASAPTGGGAGVAVSAGTTQLTSGTASFADGNGVSFGMNGYIVTASHNGLTTAAQSNHSHNFATTTTNGSQIIVATKNSDGVTIAVPPYVTAAGAGDGNNVLGVNAVATQASTTYILSNGNNVSFGVNAGTITASASYVNDLTSGRAGVGETVGTIAGTDLAMTVNTDGVSIGYPKWITTYAAQTVQPVAASASNGSFNFSTLKFVETSGVTWATATDGIRASVKTDYQSSNANYLTSQSNQAFSASGGSSAFQTLGFSNANNVTFSNSNGSVVASASFAQSTQTQPAGNIAGVGTSATNASITLNSNGLAISVAAPGGGGAINVSAGTTSGNLQTVQFNNANGVSFGLNGSTVTASVNAGGALAAYKAYPLLPVSMASSLVSSGTSGAGSTTAAMYINPLYLDRNIEANEIELLASHGALSAGTGSATIGWHLGIYTLDTAGGTTALRSVSTFSAGAYISQSSATAQSIRTYWGSTSNANSTATQGNISAAFMTAGLRDIKLYDTPFTLTSGTYYLAHCVTMRSSSVNIATSLMTLLYAGGVTNRAYLGQSTIGAPVADRYIGSVTSQITGAAGNTLSMSLPASINTTAITVSNSSAGRWLVPRFYV